MTENLAIDPQKVLQFLVKRKEHWKSEGLPENFSHIKARKEAQEALKKRGMTNCEAVWFLHRLWDRNNCGCCTEERRKIWRELKIE